jgi:hypothetical protein
MDISPTLSLIIAVINLRVALPESQLANCLYVLTLFNYLLTIYIISILIIYLRSNVLVYM